MTAASAARCSRLARVWEGDAAIAVLRGHRGRVNSAAFSPDGTQVVTASLDGTARVWDVGTAAVTVLRGHEREVNSAAFSPDGTRLVTASWDGTARVWDAATGTEMTTAQSDLDTLTDGGVLVATTIATLSTQVSFTLTAGSTDDNAYNKRIAVIIDASTATQIAVGKVRDYVGSSKTITLQFDPGVFVMAAGDNIVILSGEF